MAISLLSGPQDPSQLNNTINALIGQLNGFVNGTTPTPNQLVTGTTASPLPAFGVVTISTGTGSYTLSKPIPGVEVDIITASTKAMTVAVPAGVTINKNHTKMTFKTTNAAGGANIQQGASLIGLSTSLYGILSVIGAVKTT